MVPFLLFLHSHDKQVFLNAEIVFFFIFLDVNKCSSLFSTANRFRWWSASNHHNNSGISIFKFRTKEVTCVKHTLQIQRSRFETIISGEQSAYIGFNFSDFHNGFNAFNVVRSNSHAWTNMCYLNTHICLENVTHSHFQCSVWETVPTKMSPYIFILFFFSSDQY